MAVPPYKIIKIEGVISFLFVLLYDVKELTMNHSLSTME